VVANTSVTSGEYARLAVDVASDKLASDIVMLDIGEVSTFADYFVIMTAESGREISALTQDLEAALKAQGAALHHREGSSDSGWVLLDFSDVIVHILRPEERDFYKIEEAWSNSVEVVRVQ
jgi:ribosome-associated protein